MSALWSGGLPLSRAFWEYAILYGTLANLVATLAAFASVAAGLPVALAVVLFLAPLPYVFVAVVGVIRSAQGYSGDPFWARAARLAVVLWGGLMIVL